MKNRNLKRIFLILGLAIVTPIYFFTLFKYTGSKSVYTAFTIVAHLLLISGFYNKAIFFDAFIGVFFWLGFWLKFSIRVAFFDGNFNESVGLFDRLPSSYDKALMIVIVALIAILIAQHFRSLIFTCYKSMNFFGSISPLSNLYLKYKKFIMFFFISIVIYIGLTNYFFEIYQRGMLSKSIFPWYINSVYKWLLLFGFSSFISLILYLEMSKMKRLSIETIFLGLIENFFSSISMLSRGYILNTSAVLYGSLMQFNKLKLRVKFKSAIVLFFCVFVIFTSSVFIVNYNRTTINNDFNNINQNNIIRENLNLVGQITTPLFIDRWLGIEGVMAISSLQNLGYDLFKSSLSEVYDEQKPSFYDELILSSYAKSDFNKNHYVSMSGIVGFLYYTGSLTFVFMAMFSLCIISSFIEVISYKFSAGNMIFASLIGQVLSYRLSNFGYVPANTGLLISAILVNSFIMYILIKLPVFASKKSKLY